MSECGNWAGNNEFLKDYHDNRWCKEIHDDRELFALLCLEGMQAGLSWSTVINKEKDIREAFNNFDIDKIIEFDEEKVNELMHNDKIIKNRLKINSVIKNAKAFKNFLKSGEYSTFDEYIWHFTDGKCIIHDLSKLSDTPAQDELSQTISKDLKRKGFSFVGPVIIYSYLQAIGVYDDHLNDCPCKRKNSFIY